MDRSRTKVLIVGGGFGGLQAAKRLAKYPFIDICLIDRKNHHLFQPLLYQVAVAGLSPGDIAVPIRAQFSNRENVQVYWAEATSVTLDQNKLFTGAGNFEYDYLVLACGSRHSYFGNSDWEKNAPGLKSLEQAVEIRRRILSAFEAAESELNSKRQQELLNFVVIGGGPTGVELAGAIADISKSVLIKDFRRIDFSKVRILLVEAGNRILSSFSEASSQRAFSDLTRLGVDVRLNSPVTEVHAKGVKAAQEEIAAETIIWAAGVKASSLEINPQIKRDSAGRIFVGPDLTIAHFSNAFVIGDMALVKNSDGTIVPGVAPAAIQEGQYVAEAILKKINSKSLCPFRYVDKGQMATIGKDKAIFQGKRISFFGRPAWLAWLVVHILFLIGFKNRIFVLMQWAWSYVFSKRGARLITENDWKLKR